MLAAAQLAARCVHGDEDATADGGGGGAKAEDKDDDDDSDDDDGDMEEDDENDLSSILGLAMGGRVKGLAAAGRAGRVTSKIIGADWLRPAVATAMKP